MLSRRLLPTVQTATADRFSPADVEQSIPARFAQRCRHDPDRVAILTPSEALSYADLDAWSDAIAATVLERAGARRCPVPFLLPQSPLAVAVTLAILKSGNIYVPFDAAWSSDRIADLCRELAPPSDRAPGSAPS